MPVSHRSERVARRIQQEVARILHEDVRDPRLAEVFFTIHEVKLSRDLKYAEIYFSAFDPDGVDQVIAALERAKGFIRSQVAGVLNLRHAPELRFKLDQSIEEGLKLERLIQEANKSHPQDGDPAGR